jgi:hypothetical protein
MYGLKKARVVCSMGPYSDYSWWADLEGLEVYACGEDLFLDNCGWGVPGWAFCVYQAYPVPPAAKTMSWGKLKSLYR